MSEQVNICVLIVEDNSLISEMIKGLLEETGYTVVGEAADGLEAVEMTQSLRPDVVLMDIRMPIMDGIEATRLIYERCPTPVVVLTAYDTPALVERASAAGAGAYLVKPPNMREIEHAITIAMARFGDMMELRRLNAALQAEIAERKRAEEALGRRNEELAALNAITTEMSQSLDLKEILDAALEKTLAVLHTEGGLLYLFDETSQTFAPTVHRGLSQDVLQEITGFKLGEGLSGRAAQTGQPLLVSDLAKDLRNISPTSVKEGWRSLVSVPLKTKGKTAGVMTIASHVKDRFTPESLSLLTAIGNQIAIAIENVQLYQETVRRLEETEALGAVTTALTRSLDLDQVLQSIVDSATGLISACTGGVIHLVDEATGQLIPRATLAPEANIHERLEMSIGEGIAGLVVQEKRLINVPNVEEDSRFLTMDPASPKKSLLTAPLLIDGDCIGTLSLNSAQVGAFSADDERLLTTLAAQTTIAVRNARLHQEVQRRVEELIFLNRVGRTVTSSLNLEQILTTVMEETALVLGTEACSILLLDEESNELVFEATVGPRSEKIKGLRLPLEQGIAGWVARGGQPLLVPDVGEDPRFYSGIDEATGFATRSLLAVPLKVKKQVIGVIEAVNKTEGDFGQTDVELLSSMAQSAAIAIENARLLDAVTKHERDLQSLSAQLINAQEAERKRISQELHDEMGQALTAMSINLAAIEKELPPELAPTARERLAETSSLADQTLEQTRELALDLRPSMLDDLGLVPTLRWYVNRYAKRLNIEVEFEAIDLEERLTAEVETVLYRVVQEALTNVARHAQANRVHLRLERKESKVAAFIEDDGQGFDVEEVAGREAPARGAGLLGIRERVASLGGRFGIRSRPGQGTRLSLEIPIAERPIADC